MDARLAPLATIPALNTDLLLNGLDGLSDSEAGMGQPLPNPLAHYLADAKGIDEIGSWATPGQVGSSWRASSAAPTATV